MRRRRTHRRPPKLGVVLSGLAVFAGGVAIALSLLLPGRTSEPSPLVQEVLGEVVLEVDAASAPARARRAAAESTPSDQLPASPPAQPSPRIEAPKPPSPREPAPPEALPAVQVRSLGGSAGAPNAASPAGQASFSVVITAADDQSLDGVANELARRLNERGLDARVATLPDAGRPDAILVLGTRPEGAGEAWYCDPGPVAGATLAGALKSALADPGPASGDGSDEEGPRSAFPCDEVHAGRARVAAALLELPATSLAERDWSEGAVDSLSAAVGRYFSQNATAVRRARGAVRLVWPATGPITSYFGPGHPLGIDIGQWRGSVVAATEGKVVFAGGDACCSYGRHVVVDSQDGVRTVYAHLESLAVRTGQRVRQGQALGRVGCSGRCFGTHLHFEVLIDGKRRDPLRYLP